MRKSSASLGRPPQEMLYLHRADKKSVPTYRNAKVIMGRMSKFTFLPSFSEKINRFVFSEKGRE